MSSDKSQVVLHNGCGHEERFDTLLYLPVIQPQKISQFSYSTYCGPIVFDSLRRESHNVDERAQRRFGILQCRAISQGLETGRYRVLFKQSITRSIPFNENYNSRQRQLHHRVLFWRCDFCCSLHFCNKDILIVIIIDWGVRLLPC